MRNEEDYHYRAHQAWLSEQRHIHGKLSLSEECQPVPLTESDVACTHEQSMVTPPTENHEQATSRALQKS